MTAARRAILVVPARSERMLSSARSRAADEIVLDLEDSIHADQKAAARDAAAAALCAGTWAAPLLSVRINAAGGPWALRDVIALVEAAGDTLATLVLPKVSGTAPVLWLDLLLGGLESERGLPAGRIGIQAQIEDAAGAIDSADIARCSARLRSLVFGPLDYARSLGARPPAGRQRLDSANEDFARIQLLQAARAAGIDAVDGPCLELDDAAIHAAARRSAELGMDAQWAIHPRQLPAIREAFRPTPDRIAWARAVLAALQADGSARVDGAMVDRASVELARSILNGT
jgi:citrate lyase subunit beta/citryl-CoA lyase